MQLTTSPPGQKCNAPLPKISPCTSRAQELPEQLQGSQTARAEFRGKPAGAGKQVQLRGQVAKKAAAVCGLQGYSKQCAPPSVCP